MASGNSNCMEKETNRNAYICEDDWGQIEIIPRENYDQQLAGFLEMQEHHKDTDFSPNGCTQTPFIIPVSSVGMQSRNILLTDLKSALIPPLVASTITSQEITTGRPIEPPNTFAFAGSDRSLIYGNTKDQIVTGLFLTVGPLRKPDLEPLLLALCKIGAEHRLMLTDWGACELVDLGNPAAVRKYLQDWGKPPEN